METRSREKFRLTEEAKRKNQSSVSADRKNKGKKTSVVDKMKKISVAKISDRKKKVKKISADKTKPFSVDEMKKIVADEISDRKKKISVGQISDYVYTGKELEAIKDEYKVEGGLSPWESKYGAGMDDESQWPPIWKDKIEECPEYEALASFFRDTKDFNDPIKCKETDRNLSIYRTIHHQIQTSRGYDVTIPAFEFIPVDLDFGPYGTISNIVCRYVTDLINERAKKHDEFYVFEEAKKIVMRPLPFNECWYTFTVKRYTFSIKDAPTYQNTETVQTYLYHESLNKSLIFLKEWRFKPQSD